MNTEFAELMEALNLSPRPQQTKLVGLLDAAVAGAPVFAQAGTGTGKSYVLLTQALACARESGKPSVVVCPNNSLINQYVTKDAPRIADAVGGSFIYLKGRTRYVCENSSALKVRFLGDVDGRKSWVEKITANGEWEWANLGLTEDHGCPGSRKCKTRCVCGAKEHKRVCGYQDGFSCDAHIKCECAPPLCGILKMRELAQFSDVVITNAHLLVWNWRVSKMTVGRVQLLPEYGALFIDECHELESIGRDVMSLEIGPKSKLWSWDPAARWLAASVAEMEQADVTERVLDPESAWVSGIRQVAEERIMQLDPDKDEDEYDRVSTFLEILRGANDAVATLQIRPDGSPVLALRMISAVPMFQQVLGAQPTGLVSGTIPSSDRRRLGFTKSRITDVGHPFDYSKCKLYVSPLDPTNPGDFSGRVKTAVSAIRKVHERGGGTLVLFTSWTDLDAVSEALFIKLPPEIRDAMWVQAREYEPGTSLAQDVAEFAEHGRGVLLGVRSLYTGIDIPGPALSQVIVWKLPYQVPDAEVMAIQNIHGWSVSKDQMLMVLTQGIGRLVRTQTDEGNVLIMDRRADNLDFASNSMTHHLTEFRRI